MKPALLLALLLPALAGCAALPNAIGIAAGVSTLLKNEANCSLAQLADCTWPTLRPPAPPHLP